MMAASETPEFDVFLCHNSKDKDDVIGIAEQLEDRGLKPWLDEWELPPGQPWQRLLERQIGQIKSAAVFVGADGFGPWQELEIETFLREFVRRQCPVIPVLLPVAPRRPALPLFLSGMTWVDFRPPKRQRPARMTPLERLVWGITGEKWIPSAEASAAASVEVPAQPATSAPIAQPEDPKLNNRAETQTPLSSGEGLGERVGKTIATSRGSERYTKDRDDSIRNPTEPEPKDFVEDLRNGVRLEMVRIPAGEFLMGSPENDPGKNDDEQPQHRVQIPEFLLGKFPVTQAQWRAVAALPQVERALDADPSRFKGNNLPVERVSWLDVMEFCTRLSRKTGKSYRLPSEAEWEYACRAKTTTLYSFGDAISPKQANFGGKKGQTTEIGNFPANAFGLYDMHGNVWEWCADNWHENYDGAPTDGRAWCDRAEDVAKVLRGGSWYYYPRYCRSAYRGISPRDVRDASLGFRVCCDAPRTRPLSA